MITPIVQLDPDRARIDIIAPSPAPCPRMPRARSFIYHLDHFAIARDQIMGRDLRLRIAKPVDRSLRALHRGIVEHHHVGPSDLTAPRTAIW